MTQIEIVANIAEVVSGVAILISLIYVGFQIRQSNRFARAENTRFVLDASLFDGYNYAVVAGWWKNQRRRPVLADPLTRCSSGWIFSEATVDL
jgi:hypothetical protein